MRLHLQPSVIHFLEIFPPYEFEIFPSNDKITFERNHFKTTEKYLQIYNQIGSTWNWTDRLLLSDSNLLKILQHPHNHIYTMNYEDKIAGFFEMFISEYESELVYFGLDSKYFGRGFGQIMMNKVKRICTEENIKRLWLHTCNFDSKAALSFYQKSGFKIYKKASGIEKHIF
ncbi:MAG: hypothetical protein AUJ98_10425 [Bacteroidetes bacterium CG2_30_33_31]|nr:MAG: hypothetical protein AUJ98_10425 [Bacteroidetes bacterium CG2_30_33_31]